MSLISVILPVYNGEKYLFHSIDSILNQSYKNFELIIVNDGSTDGSRNIIENYSSQDDRIKALHRDNKGLVYSLNEAIDIAKGDWIARMDQDDISLPYRLEGQLKYIQKSSSDFCGSWVERFGSTRNSIWRMPISDIAIKMYMLFGCPLIHPSTMGRTSAFRYLKYDYDFEGAEDYDLWVRAAIEGFTFTNVPKVLIKYRVHNSQMTNKFALTQKNLSGKVKEKYWIKISKEYRLGNLGADCTFNFLCFNFDKHFLIENNTILLKLINSEIQNSESKTILIKEISYRYIWAECSSSIYSKLRINFNKELGLKNNMSIDILIFITRLLRIRYEGSIHLLVRYIKYYILNISSKFNYVL